MKNLFLTLCLTILASYSYAQKTISVLSGTTWTFYEDFSTALRQAPNGSTIYLPGGIFKIPDGTDTISKTINIIGVGHYPDSTIATSRSVIDGKLMFSRNSDNTNIIGVEINGNLLLDNQYSNYIINNIYLNRCKVQGTIYLFEDIQNIKAINVNITESVLGSIWSPPNESINLTVTNSIIPSMKFGQNYGALYKNNIIGFIGYCNAGCVGYSLNCTFENNIIWGFYNGVLSQSIFVNNLILSSCTSCLANINNIIVSDINTQFVNVPNLQIFDYSYDYHLKSNSLGKNAGSDGTDIGIYGTAYPYKPSAVPPNPHISAKSIAPSSQSNGTLPVNIKVVAQDK